MSCKIHGRHHYSLEKLNGWNLEIAQLKKGNHLKQTSILRFELLIFQGENSSEVFGHFGFATNSNGDIPTNFCCLKCHCYHYFGFGNVTAQREKSSELQWVNSIFFGTVQVIVHVLKILEYTALKIRISSWPLIPGRTRLDTKAQCLAEIWIPPFSVRPFIKGLQEHRKAETNQAKMTEKHRKKAWARGKKSKWTSTILLKLTVYIHCRIRIII